MEKKLKSDFDLKEGILESLASIVFVFLPLIIGICFVAILTLLSMHIMWIGCIISEALNKL